MTNMLNMKFSTVLAPFNALCSVAWASRRAVPSPACWLLFLAAGCGDGGVSSPSSPTAGAGGQLGAAGAPASTGGTATAGNAGSSSKGGAAGAATGGATSGGTPSAGGGAGGTATAGAPGAGTAGTAGTAGSSSTAGAGGGGSAPRNLPGFYVDGRFLYDRCGERVVLRGVNEMIVWSGGKDGVPEYAEIAKTNANAVRIVWTVADGTASELDTAITNALAQKLIPMIELHDATGDFSKLGSLVQYWTSSAVVAVIKKHEQNLLVNIGNEVGNASVTNDAFAAGYKDAITRMRDAGIRTPLVVDGSSWGQNIDQLQAVGPSLVTHDPDHNLLLSVHVWWPDATTQKITDEITQSVNANLPLIIGEFAQHAVSGCSQNPTDYKTLLALSQTHSIGWLAWSWGSVKNSDCGSDGPFDMTTNGTFAGLTGWGNEVAVSDANSIQKTSKRPASIVNGACP
jgi:mannan endo-1,4-beta-mannosidase